MITYQTKEITIKEARPIIEKWHYSHSINGVRVSKCFGLFDNEELIGAAIFGKPAMAGQWRKYAEKEKDLLELRRLAIIDNTPRNTESWFIGKMLRFLRKNTQIKVILSYSDLNQGHEGVIYKASNFEFRGKTAKGRVIMYQGKKYHDKAIRTKNNGVLKPFAIKLKEALSAGEAFYLPQLPKNIYTYSLVK